MSKTDAIIRKNAIQQTVTFLCVSFSIMIENVSKKTSIKTKNQQCEFLCLFLIKIPDSSTQFCVNVMLWSE